MKEIIAVISLGNVILVSQLKYVTQYNNKVLELKMNEWNNSKGILWYLGCRRKTQIIEINQGKKRKKK